MLAVGQALDNLRVIAPQQFAAGGIQNVQFLRGALGDGQEPRPGYIKLQVGYFAEVGVGDYFMKLAKRVAGWASGGPA